MKKLLIVATSALALAGTASAQLSKTANVEQIGSSNLATVNQTAGNQAIAEIEQDGASNDAKIEQLDDAGSGQFSTAANDASIKQIGAGALATILQSGEAAAVSPNTASIEQYGSGVTHGGTGIPSGGSLEASIEQSGTANLSTVVQSAGYPGSGFSAVSTQFGDANMSDIQQYDDSNDVNPYSAARVDQTGAQNISDVRQNGANSFAFVAQTGDQNTSDVKQNYGSGQFANVVQTSHNSQSLLNQEANDVEAMVTQGLVGDHYSDVWQRLDGDGATATVTQTGSQHFSYLEQSNESGTATVVQTNDRNSSLVVQNAGLLADAIVNQFGDSSRSEIMQAGSYQQASVVQLGDSNENFLDQDEGGLGAGVGNFASVMQSTDLNTSTILQSGNANSTTVTQTVAHGNSSTVNQLGSSHTATVSQ